MTYQIHRYPSDLIDVVQLNGPERILIRPVLPQDSDLTLEFFASLSAPARYDRFMSPMRHLPPDLLRRFTEIDYANHLALVAEVFIDQRETVIAEARYVRGETNSAEFAVSVAEPWQGRGLATLMLKKLSCRAAQAGVQRLTGETLAGNVRMLSLARKAGFTIRRSDEVAGVMTMEKAVDAALLAANCNESLARTSHAA
jgi:acetyltransferase